MAVYSSGLLNPQKMSSSEIYPAPAVAERPARKNDWPSAVQLGLSLIGIFLCLSFALGFFVIGVTSLLNPQAGQDNSSSFLLAASAALCGALLLPSAGLSLLRLLNQPAVFPAWLEKAISLFTHLLFIILLLPVVLLLGYLASRLHRIDWLFLPPLHLLAVGLPILLFCLLGRRGLSVGSPQRTWGIFGLGLVLGPAVIMVLEILAILVFVVLAIVYISSQPALARQIMQLIRQLNSAGSTPEEIISIFGPVLAKPGVILSILLFTSIIVPLIEEALKPIGAWVLMGQNPTPAMGFSAGLLSGAGYALFENLSLSTVGGGDWLSLVVARIGTGLLHITTAGLTGWALALAWTQRRYLRLALTYLLAAFIHGLWNSLALLSTASSLPAVSGGALSARLDLISMVGLVALALIMFLVLLGLNRRFRSENRPIFRSENADYPSAD